MKKKEIPGLVINLILCAVVLFPVVYMLAGSSLDSFYQVFLRRPDYLLKFWKTLLMAVLVVAANVMVSCMGGYAFAKYHFRWKRGIYLFLIILMIMPVQATLVPNYIILEYLHLLDTWAALMLPCIFHPFGVVLMTQVFRGIPDEMLDTARMDGASTWQVLWRIVVPAGRSGLIGLILLTFVDVWNMVEQPMVFLKDVSDYPLSVFLAVFNETNVSISFTSGLFSMLPIFLLLLYCKDEIVQGAEFSGLKKKVVCKLTAVTAILLLLCTIISGWIYDIMLPRVVAASPFSGVLSEEDQQYDYLVPLSAVYTDLEGSYVFRIKEKDGIFRVERCTVSILASDDLYAAIYGFFDENDSFAAYPSRQLVDGENVKLTE